MRKILPVLWVALLAFSAAAEDTRFWHQNKYAQFSQGTPWGVALRSDGEILLAPEFRELADPNLEYVWDVVEDPRGNLYLAGGSPAKVIKLGADGQVTTVFESKELEVHALALDPRDASLYLATSPDGRVHKITPAGKASVFFEPGTKYLWDIVLHADGTLYLATGDKGEIYRIAPDGTGELFFKSDETHIRSFALAPNGQLYAGTEPNGLVLRLSPDGQAFVLYEMDRKEVTNLLFDSAGNLYVAAIGRKAPTPAFPRAPTPAAPTQPPVTSAQGVTPSVVVTATAPATSTQPAARRPGLPRFPAGGSTIIRIAPDGSPEKLWASRTELVYSLSFATDGRLLAGTGNKGKLLAIDSATLFTHLAKASGQQITAVVRGQRGNIFAATANPGKVYRLGPELASEGIFESDVFDAELFSQWGRVRWQTRSPGNPTVRLFTRTGNTSDPQKHWSAWSEAYTEAAGSVITSPQARFIQWKTVLKATDGRTPSLSEVSIAYLRRNLPPRVTKIIVQTPGIALRKLSTPQAAQPVQLELPSASNTRARAAAPASASNSSKTAPRIAPAPHGVAQTGARSVIWSTEDPNQDELIFSVYYRGEEETRWKLMKDNLSSSFHSWDAATLPDGAYHIKVVASDAPSNPPDLSLSGENLSDRFEVDNTPPRIDNLTAAPRSRTVEVRFRAQDSYSPLQKAEYSLDAGEWKSIFPASRTTDARQHSYTVHLKDLEPGEHTVVVRVYDQFDNPVLAKTTFLVR